MTMKNITSNKPVFWSSPVLLEELRLKMFFIPPAYEVCHGGIMFLSFLYVCVCVCVC